MSDAGNAAASLIDKDELMRRVADGKEDIFSAMETLLGNMVAKCSIHSPTPPPNPGDGPHQIPVARRDDDDDEQGEECSQDGISRESLASCNLRNELGTRLVEFPSLSSNITEHFQTKRDASKAEQRFLSGVRAHILQRRRAGPTTAAALLAAHAANISQAKAHNSPDLGWSAEPVKHWALFGAKASQGGNPCPAPQLPPKEGALPPILMGGMLTYATNPKHMVTHHRVETQSNYTMALLYEMVKTRPWFENSFFTDNRFFANGPDAKIPPADLKAFSPGLKRFMAAQAPLMVVFAGSNRYNFARTYAEPIKETGVDMGKVLGVPSLGFRLNGNSHLVLFAPHPSSTLWKGDPTALTAFSALTKIFDCVSSLLQESSSPAAEGLTFPVGAPGWEIVASTMHLDDILLGARRILKDPALPPLQRATLRRNLATPPTKRWTWSVKREDTLPSPVLISSAAPRLPSSSRLDRSSSTSSSTSTSSWGTLSSHSSSQPVTKAETAFPVSPDKGKGKAIVPPPPDVCLPRVSSSGRSSQTLPCVPSGSKAIDFFGGRSPSTSKPAVVLIKTPASSPTKRKANDDKEAESAKRLKTKADEKRLKHFRKMIAEANKRK